MKARREIPKRLEIVRADATERVAGIDAALASNSSAEAFARRQAFDIAPIERLASDAVDLLNQRQRKALKNITDKMRDADEDLKEAAFHAWSPLTGLSERAMKRERLALLEIGMLIGAYLNGKLTDRGDAPA